MRFAFGTTSRFLTWLAAILIPLQSLPMSAPCGCISSSGSNPCCQHVKRSSCCPKNDVRNCCASKANADCQCCCRAKPSSDGICRCGVNCRCNQDNAPRPATPPAQNRTVNKIVEGVSSTNSLAMPLVPQVPTRVQSNSSHIDGLDSLDACASLCRYIL